MLEITKYSKRCKPESPDDDDRSGKRVKVDSSKDNGLETVQKRKKTERRKNDKTKTRIKQVSPKSDKRDTKY